MKVFKIFLFLTLLSVGFVDAKTTYGNLQVKNVERVHDGDTFIANIDDIHPLIGQAISVRINGIDTPEITDKRPQVKELAYRARDYTMKRIQEAQSIELINVQRDKYFRILADVYLDGSSLAEELLEQGLAQPYDGKTKPTNY